MKVLQDRHVLTLALNVPGPVAAARLAGLGATVTKVEPPGGDPLATVSPTWYRALHEGLAVQQIDLKTPEGRAALEPLLAAADLLLTANRPAALARLGLDWPPCMPASRAWRRWPSWATRRRAPTCPATT